MPTVVCVRCNQSFQRKTSDVFCPNCRVFTGNCQLCDKEFTRQIFASFWQKYGDPRFCSPTCRNISNAQKITLKEIPCPICGTPLKPYRDHGQEKQYCSPGCGYRAQALRNQERREPIEQAIKQSYTSKGPDHIAGRFGITIQRVQRLAYRLGITLNKDTYYDRVHEVARKRMKTNNPMKRPEVVAKVVAWQRAHPDVAATHSAKARSRNQRENPSGLELKLRQILTSLGIEFEPSAVIKPKFVVDIRIGNLIIQADGGYWHGHPRFEPLTDRQITQQKRDKAQDAYLHKCGYNVVRIWESDMSLEKLVSVLQMYGVM